MASCVGPGVACTTLQAVLAGNPGAVCVVLTVLEQRTGVVGNGYLHLDFKGYLGKSQSPGKGLPQGFTGHLESLYQGMPCVYEGVG